MLKEFNDAKNFKSIKKKYELPNDSKPLNEHIKELKDLDCEVHIFLDKVKDRTNKKEHIGLTNELFEEI